MKDELVTFETAKLAKEKGFDILTDYEYREYIKDFKVFNYRDDEIGELKGSIVLRNKSSYQVECEYGTYIYFNTPTQSLLQRWLRDVHSIYVEVRFNDVTFRRLHNIVYKEQPSDYRGIYFKLDPSQGDLYMSYSNNFTYNTYEEALEQALQEALKLI
jgi:hypothetical protein